ncbi:hypothetical protein CDD80_4881 [Ophiocordyceps camponoti-rufipedis]|uniref:Uncharacterized protein n=1 Tax=Ophiocordyceps camponoti-rufipedis TaxID=2004952 RepID=A0A2C5YR12_9HYPO|nr:hypothetical protein CDD80_4881 [Ophiocordyceps camponoti-rufipedis]
MALPMERKQEPSSPSPSPSPPSSSSHHPPTPARKTAALPVPMPASPPPTPSPHPCRHRRHRTCPYPTAPPTPTTSQFLPIASLLNPHKGLKRRRTDDDVDGPDTAALSSKKRRLGRLLVTSRLSSPYSQPALYTRSRHDQQQQQTGLADAAREAQDVRCELGAYCGPGPTRGTVSEMPEMPLAAR